MKKCVFIALICFLPLFAVTQTTWSLQQCIDYAVKHNISIRQADVQARLSALQLKQSKWMQVPSLNFGTNAQDNFGRSVNMATYQFTTNSVFYQNYALQAGITLFNFFNIRNSIKSAKAQDDANKADIYRVENDLILNVMAAYLQCLLSTEQVNIARGQIELSKQQLDLTRKQVAAGALPELNTAQLESQLATDSSTYINNVMTMNQNKLQLMAYLNLSADTDFEVSMPDIDHIPLEPLSDMQPKEVYQIALHNQYQQKVDSLKIISAIFAMKSAKAQLYPTISASASLSSSYSNQFTTYSNNPIAKLDTTGIVNVNGTNYYSVLPTYSLMQYTPSYWRQIFDINRSEFIGLTLSIPIFNNRQYRTAYERAKENIITAQLQQEQNNQTLQQNIYTAYNNAASGIQQYNANTKGEQYAQYAYDLAQKRYDIGMLSASDYLVSQNNLYTAKMNRAASHYDYIFRLKVLEFYKYNHIQL